MPTNRHDQPVGEPLPDWTAPSHPPRTAMQGRHCLVRPLAADDAPALWEAFGADVDGHDWTYLPYGPFDRYNDFARWVSTVAAADDPLFHAIVPAEAPQTPAGVASYLRIAPAAGSIEVGHIHIGPRLQRTPASTEAMYLMMRRAFELGYRRYEWKCDALNAPSRRAAARLGFSYEGTFRQAVVVKGRNRDTAWYACIDREWPALRAAFETWLSPDNFDADGRQRRSLSSFTASILVARG